MAYSEKKKNEVIDLYESGMPRSEDCQGGRDLTFDRSQLDEGDRISSAIFSHLPAMQEAQETAEHPAEVLLKKL